MSKKVEAEDLNKIYIWQFELTDFLKTKMSVELLPFPNSAIRQWVHLTVTKCNLGGVRLWFKCSDCSRRVGVLFVGEYGYSCRHCLNLTYKSKKINRRKKDFDLLRRFQLFFKAGELTDQLKRLSYRGKETRMMRKIEKLYLQAGIS